MTFTHRLSRRLARLRNVGATSFLAIIAACSGGDSTGPTGSSSSSPSALSKLIDIVASPSPVTVLTGSTQAFSASAKRHDGSSETVRITWSATGGSIDAQGNYTAGTTPGDYLVVANATSANAADTVHVTVANSRSTSPSSSSSDYTDEPPGLTRFAENALSSLPTYPRSTSGAAGAWYSYPAANPNLSTVSDGPRGSAMRTRFPAGFTAGNAPANVGGWDASGRQKRSVYLSFWIKFGDHGFENHPSGTKLGFIAYGQDPNRAAHNQGYFWIDGPGSVKVQSSWSLVFIQQNHVGRRLDANVNSAKLLTTGGWHHVEAAFRLNSHPDTRDGSLKIWVDGQMTHNYGDVVYTRSGNTNGFFDYNWVPVWGGFSGPVKTRDDYIELSQLYLSGE